MTRKLLFCSAAMMAMGHYATAQTPQITNFNHDGDSCFVNSPAHAVYVGGNVGDAVTGLNVTTYWGDGASTDQPVTTQANFGWFGNSHSYMLPGTYTVMAVLFDAANNPIDSSQITVDAFCYALSGVIYKRIDANCTYDYNVDEPINTFQEIEVRKNNIPIDTFIASNHFYYTVPEADLTSEFSLHPLNTPSGFQQVCPTATDIYKIRLDTLTGGNNHFEYGYECGPGSDFDLFTYMTGFLRFVNSSYLTIYAGNTACTPQNGNVTLNIDPQYVFVNSSPSPATISGQTITWDLINLTGTNYGNIYVTLNPVDTLTPGDTSCHTVSISPTAGDINAANNTFTFCDTIHASYDPNEKKVSPMGDIAAGELLTYTINFENLGNDTAFNVHILDTLSNNVDASSFKLIASSHPVRINFFNNNGGRIVKFEFPDIGLADKDHPESNKGFIMYKVKAKNNLAAGTEVKNTAHIYFDINPSIVTNTVASKIPDPTSIRGINKEDGIIIYPNPTDDVLFIENKNGLYSEVTIINTLGQTMLQQNLRQGLNRMTTSSLASGMYYIITNGRNGAGSMKITKK